MEYDINIVGFHGTNKTAANTILEEKRFIPKENKNHWLGQGVYFFREDNDQALSWAIQQSRVTKDSEAVVLKVDIKVEKKYFFNLNSRVDLFRLKKIVTSIYEKLQKIEFELSFKDDGEFDAHAYRCAIIDLIPINIMKIVQNNFPFEQPQPLRLQEFKQMDIRMHSIQVCVRDLELIKGDKIKMYSKFPMNRKSNIGKTRNIKINY